MNFDIDRKNNIGETPLYIAVTLEDTKTVKFLINKGANVNIDAQGTTPLGFAIMSKNPEIELILRRSGAKTMKELKENKKTDNNLK
jgi:ankyrin repeat protein